MPSPHSAIFVPRQFGMDRFTRGRVVQYHQPDYWGYRGGTGALGIVVADSRDASKIPDATDGNIIRVVYENGWIENHVQTGAHGWLEDKTYVDLHLRDTPYTSDADVFAALRDGLFRPAFALTRNPLALLFPELETTP